MHAALRMPCNAIQLYSLSQKGPMTCKNLNLKIFFSSFVRRMPDLPDLFLRPCQRYVTASINVGSINY